MSKDATKIRAAELRFHEAQRKLWQGLTMKGGGQQYESLYSSAYAELSRLDPTNYPKLRGKYRDAG